jgi:hypothetical protein
MAAPPLRQFGSFGTINDEHADDSQLYITPEECQTKYGMSGVNVGQIRFAMNLINAVCNRTSLWVETYEERINLASDRLAGVLSHRPVIDILEAVGRYGYSRRDRRVQNQSNYDYIAALAVFGSPPGFTQIDVSQIECYDATGEFWLPTGFFLIGYTQVQIKYTAGFVELPARVKAALINVINNVCTRGASNRVQFGVGRTSQKFESGVRAYIDDVTLSMLEPYITRTLA